MAEERCECEATSVLVFACAGSSNVGQLSNAAAVQIARQGRARMYCLAGIGAHVPGMVDSAQHVTYCVALDGCPTACARKTLEHAGVRVDKALIVTELGIPKSHDLAWGEEDLGRVIVATTDAVARAQSTACADATHHSPRGLEGADSTRAAPARPDE